MSDALCRPAVLSRELHPLAFAPSAFVLRRRRLVSRRARVRCHAAWLGQQGHLTQDAFSRLDAQPCGRAKPIRVHLTFARDWLPHPFVRPGQTHHRRDGDCLDVLPGTATASLSDRRHDAGKMRLTSLCNRSTTRAPTDRSIPKRTTYAELTAHRTDTCSERPYGVLPPCGNRTPGGYALDGTFPTLAKPPTTLPNGKGRAPHRAMPPRRSVFNRVQGCSIWPLTLLVLPHRNRRPSPVRQQEPFRSLPRQRERLSGPEVPSIDKCSRRSPPPCSRLSHRRAGFQHSFASRMLAHIKARPATYPQVLHPWA
jgi:hypothetical protein